MTCLLNKARALALIRIIGVMVVGYSQAISVALRDMAVVFRVLTEMGPYKEAYGS